MAAQTTTTRKPRQPKATTPTLAAWPRLDHDAIARLLAEIRKAHDAIMPVPRYHSQADKAALDAIDRDSAEEEADGKHAAARQADEAHAAVNSGWSLSRPVKYDGSAYERAWRGELAGCGDASPAAFTSPVRTIPVVQEASTLGPLDPEKERQFRAAFEEDTSGPAVPDPPAGPEVHEERQDDEALDKAPVLVISSDPTRMKKTSGEDGEAL